VYARIKVKRVDAFYKKCIDIETGLVEENFGNFLEFDESLHTKDGVDFKTAVFVQYRESKKDFFERRVLIFYEKPNPEFIEGQNVRYITQGNVLKSYEIVKEGEDIISVSMYNEGDVAGIWVSYEEVDELPVANIIGSFVFFYVMILHIYYIKSLNTFVYYNNNEWSEFLPCVGTITDIS
jgi:hypothetical protein